MPPLPVVPRAAATRDPVPSAPAPPSSQAPPVLLDPLSGASPEALAETPPEMVSLYQQAALTCPGMSWTLLAGVGKVESDHGRNPGVSTAGAVGPMQFLPSTWASYGRDGSGDGVPTITDPADAVYSAANYLCTFGAGRPDGVRRALYAYNHAWWYVDVVLGHATRYAGMHSATTPAPSPEALADIPAPLLTAYQQAAPTCPGTPWTVLAAMGKIDSDQGRRGVVGTGERVGLLRFPPDEWARYGVDGDGDGLVFAGSTTDSAFGGAAWLCARQRQGSSTMAEALAGYRPAPDYPARVLEQATRYGSAAPLAPGTADVGALLRSPRLTMSPQARSDLALGAVDPRVVAVLNALVASHSIDVGVFRTGHSTYVAGSNRVSNHYYGRAVDIGAIDGQPVSVANGAARTVVQWLAGFPAELTPSEVGSPFAEFEALPAFFSDASHTDHLHIGYGDN